MGLCDTHSIGSRSGNSVNIMIAAAVIGEAAEGCARLENGRFQCNICSAKAMAAYVANGGLPEGAPAPVTLSNSFAMVRHWNTKHLNCEPHCELFTRCPHAECRRHCLGNNGLTIHYRNSPTCKPGGAGPGGGIGNGVGGGAGGFDPLAQVDDNALVGLFRNPLSNIHHSWKDNFYEISVTMLEGMAGGVDCHQITLAFFLLPGVIVFLGKAKVAGRPVDMLREAAEADSAVEMAGVVILWAKRLHHRYTNGDFQSPRPKQSFVGGLKRQIAASLRSGRLSAARRSTDALGGVLDAIDQGVDPGGGLVPQLSKEEIAAAYVKYYPGFRSDDLDTISNPAGDGAFDPNLEAPGIQVTQAECLQAIKALKVDSASGQSGWTPNAIKFLAAHSTTVELKTRLGEAMAGCFNSFWGGSMAVDVVVLWTNARSVFIPKDGGGLRPLGLKDVWYRMMARMVVSQVGLQIAELIGALQTGIGVVCGSEIGGHAGQLAAGSVLRSTLAEIARGDDHVLMSLDMRNFFNELGLNRAFASLRQLCPGLIRGCGIAYSKQSAMYGPSGELDAWRMIGVSQGCPLSGVLAAACIYAAGLEIKALMASTEAATPRLSPPRAGTSGFFLSYMDDLQLANSARVMALMVDQIVAILARYGSTVQPNKSVVLVKDAAATAAAGRFEGMVLTEVGMKVLGNYVGTDEYRATEGGKKLATMQPNQKALLQIPPRGAFLLLYYCYNQCPQFLSRMLGPDLPPGALSLFDDSIDESIRAITGMSMSAWTHSGKLLRGIPAKQGGLGIRRCDGMAMVKGVLHSRALTREYFRRHSDELLHLAADRWPALCFGEAEGRVLADEDAAAMASGDAHLVQKVGREEMAKASGEAASALYERYGLDGDLGRCRQAQILSAQGAGSLGAWWASLVGLEGGDRFWPEESWRAALRNALHGPLTNGLGAPVTTCAACSTGGQATQIGGWPTHPTGCGQVGNFVGRHNEVVDRIAETLKGLGLPGLRVEKFILLPTLAGEAANIEMDIVLKTDNMVRHIDVAVVDPGAPKYVIGGSATSGGRAAVMRENSKIRKYAAAMPGLDQATCFVPFVVETSGRLGKKAVEFLAFLKLPDDVSKRLHRALVLILARQGGRSFAAFRKAGG